LGNIQSSTAKVQSVVKNMENVVESISNVDKSIQVASRTTVAGNSLASEKMEKHTALLNQLVSAFKQDVERLKKVSNEFESTDQHIARMIM